MSHEKSTPRLVDEIYREFGRELWALFYAQCCDAEAARDALHEAIVRLHEYKGLPLEDPRAWLLTVGRNWLRDAARRRKVAAKTSELLDTLPSSQLNAESIVAFAETQTLVRTGLAELRPDDREVLVLRYALGWSSERIAVVVESTSTAVDMRLSRARRRLAQILERLGVTHEFV
ncbi:MAG: RNA polymerase sigma factor [Planctomycetaceae bacterium]